MAYFTKVTETGAAVIAAAIAAGETIPIAQLCVGDGNGSDYEPVGTETALVHQVWAGAVTGMASDGDTLTVEAAIPHDVGGWTIREIGILDSDGALIAIGNYPETLKPAADAGGLVVILIRMIVKFDTDVEGVIEIPIDPGSVYATREYAEQAADNAVASHSALLNVHGAVPTATPSRLVARDGNGRAAFAPGASDGDAVVLSQLNDHINLNSTHGAVPTATPSRLVLRDGNGRAAFAPGASDGDAVVLSQLNDHINLTGVHGATAADTALRLALRDSNGRAAFGPGITGNEAIVFSQFEANWTDKWFKIPGGLIIQWGQALSTTEKNWITHNFNVAFPNAALVIVGSRNAGFPTLDPTIAIQIVSVGQFRIYNTGYENSLVNWIAFGR